MLDTYPLKYSQNLSTSKSSVETSRHRYFTIINKETNEHKGRYYGRTPEKAAYKACQRLMKDAIINGNTKHTTDGIIFCIRELNKNEPKDYYFQGNVKCKKPFFCNGDYIGDFTEYTVKQLSDDKISSNVQN